MIDSYNAWRRELLDEIELLLLNTIDNLCGGLFAAEIRLMLEEKGVKVSSNRIALLIKNHGRHIKIQPVQFGSKWINLYSINPPLDLNKGNFVINANLGYYDSRQKVKKE